MRKIIIWLVLLVISFNLPAAFAKKKLIRHRSNLHTYAVWVKPLLRADRQALLFALAGMDQAREVNYSLTYTADSVPQGVQGVHDPKLGNTQRELVFGTCSGTNCTYHQNITDMLLAVTIKLKSGQTYTAKYQIKI